MDNDMTAPAYEPPSLEVVGTLTELTLGDWGFGNADSFTFTIWGHEITIPYGTS